MGESVLEMNKKRGFLPNISSCVFMTSSEARLTNRGERAKEEKEEEKEEEQGRDNRMRELLHKVQLRAKLSTK